MIRRIPNTIPYMLGTFAIAVGLGVSAPTASAASLAQEADINNRLLEIAVADEIRKSCDVISPRIFTAWRRMQALKAEAIARGYTEAEIEAYVNDKDEKRKMRARSDAYVREHEAEPNDAQSLCRLGKEEIAKQSRIGSLLVAR